MDKFQSDPAEAPAEFWQWKQGHFESDLMPENQALSMARRQNQRVSSVDNPAYVRRLVAYEWHEPDSQDDPAVTPAHEPVKLVIDLDDRYSKTYGAIHQAGCRDARDPEPIGSATRRAEVGALANAITGWDDNPDQPKQWNIAPCAASQLANDDA